MTEAFASVVLCYMNSLNTQRSLTYLVSTYAYWYLPPFNLEVGFQSACIYFYSQYYPACCSLVYGGELS